MLGTSLRPETGLRLAPGWRNLLDADFFGEAHGVEADDEGQGGGCGVRAVR